MALDLDLVFDHHPPTNPAVGAMHDEVRERFKDLATWVDAHMPESREKSQILSNLDEGCQRANACVARYQVELPS